MRLYLRKQSPSAVDHPALLGTPVDKLRSRFTRTGVTADGWEQFGPGLHVRVADNMVAAVGLACRRGFPRAFAWAGLPKVTWQRYRRRGGFSEGAFTSAGRARRGRIVLGARTP